MQPDIKIIYMSRAVGVFETRAIQLLSAEAASKNAKINATGLLIKVGNYFLQVLEGPVGPITDLIKKIALDPRHSQLRILYREMDQHRVFSQWAMACLDLNEEYTVDVQEFRELRERVYQILSSKSPTKDSMMEVIRAFPALLRSQKESAIKASERLI
jgi:hypothetical protein